ncbi:hypothetical protein KACHI17_04900 [Sediminibacterium sp. KACHI17]|uniref:Collagen-like protein n=1 Tax=Sediminibacterium sp. KACHI17 TaxID=1751071 RepID=A0AAT9GG57_9BACT
MSVINRSHRRQKKSDWNAEGTVQEILNKPIPLKGDKGDQGIQGIQGVKGDKGDQGIQGIQGVKGDKGDQGIQGIQGIKGDKGDQGIQGIQGVKGDKGDQGIQGIQGVKGDKGDKGDPGSSSAISDELMIGFPASYKASLFKFHMESFLELMFFQGEGFYPAFEFHENGDFTSFGNISAANFGSGSYSPTLSYTNGSATPYADFHWTRVGDIVRVTGHLLANAVSGTSHYCKISLPIESEFTLPEDVSGCSVTALRQACPIIAHVIDNVAYLQIDTTSTGNYRFIVDFTYKIKTQLI